MSKTVLVIGGAGYVGSQTCKALAQAGYVPVVYDNLSTGHEWAVQWGPIELGDIADHERLQTVIEQHRPRAVLHFAGLIAVGESVGDPTRYYRVNVAGTLNVLEVMQSVGLDRIIFSSSAAVYGDPEDVPIAETHPTRPTSPYGWSKLMVERMLADAASAYGLKSVSLRYFNAHGADAEVGIGEAHKPETHLIPLVLETALGRRNTITIFGGDYATPDGTCIRDYVHVADLADAHVHALHWLENTVGACAEVINLGNGEGYSILQVIETARAVTGRVIKAHVTARRDGDPPILVASNDRARRVMGWRPVRPTLETQITDAWAWHRHMSHVH